MRVWKCTSGSGFGIFHKVGYIALSMCSVLCDGKVMHDMAIKM